jgi:hypothetical protein
MAGPLAATVGTLALLVHLGFGDASMLVLGGALCVTQARRPGEASVAATLTRLPLMMLAACGLGLIFAHSTAGADVVYLAVFLAARLAWRRGPAFDTAGRAVLLPLISLFLAPQVQLAHHPATGIAQVLVATVVAAAWGLAVPRLWKPGPPSVAPLAAAVRAGRGVRAAALELDSQLPPNATAARLAVLAVEASPNSADSAPALICRRPSVRRPRSRTSAPLPSGSRSVRG